MKPPSDGATGTRDRNSDDAGTGTDPVTNIGFTLALQEVDQAIFRTDPDGVITFVNPAFESITGYSASEAIGQTPRILKSGAHPEAYYAQLWETISNGSIWKNEIINQRKNGELYTAYQTILPVVTDDEIEQYIAIQTDYSDQLRREEQINVLDRVLRHNLRNELTIARGHIATVDHHHPEVDGELETAMEAIDAVIDLSEKVRKFTSYTAPDVSRQEFDIVSMIEKACLQLRDTYPEAHFDITGIEELTILAYPSIELAIHELLQNAAKHAGEQPAIEVTVSAQYQSVDVVIRDDGPGLPETEQLILRGESETPLEHGSGVGLWVVDMVLRDHGGDISVDSGETGTTVTLSLPYGASPETNVQTTTIEDRGIQIRERYRSVFEHALDAMLLISPDGFITEANAAAASLCGVSNKELRGRGIETFFPEYAWEQLRQLGDATQRLSFHTEDDIPRVVEYSSREDILLDSHIVFLRDVTERVEYADALERHRALLRNTERLTDVGGWEADLETGEQQWTEGTYRIYGLDPDTDPLPSVEEAMAYYHEADREAIEAAVAACYEHGEPYEEILRLISADGELKYVQTNGEPIFEDDEVIKIRGAIRDITEQVEREEELDRSYAEVESILESINDAVFLHDTDGAILYVNDTAVEWLGYSKDRLLTMNILELEAPEQGQYFHEDLDRLLEEDSLLVDTVFVTNDGNHIPTELNSTVIIHQGQRAVLSVARDIAERRRRERELERMEEFLTEVERLGDLGAWECDEAGTITWTAGTRRIHDVPDEFNPSLENAIEFYHPDDRERIREAVTKAFECGESYEVEARIITAHGEQRWIQTKGVPVNDGAAIRGYIRDITDEKTREHELNERIKELTALHYIAQLFTNHEGDAKQVLATIADTLPQYFQHPDRTVVRITYKDHQYASGDFPDVAERLTASTVTEHGDRITIEAVLEEGAMSASNKSASFLAHEADLLNTIVAFLKPNVERREWQRLMAQQNDRLERFAQVVGHDLRNPLSVAAGNLERIDEHVDMDAVDDLRQALERMEAIIEETLTLAKHGKVVTEFESIDLESLARECWDFIDSDGTALHVTESCSIAGDRERLRHVFENLFQNVIAHGGDVGTITVGQLQAGGGFFVEDDGEGIPPEVRDRLFEPGVSTASDGTGYGLVIVNEIIEAHGWEITVTEAADGGARFEITSVDVID